MLAEGKLRASVVPAELDFTACPYMWPYCMQSFYASAQPVIFNATVLNGLGAYGTFAAPPQWVPSDKGGALLDVLFTYSDALWPWSGHVSLHITVKEAGAKFTGAAHGTVKFTVESPPGRGERVRPRPPPRMLTSAKCSSVQVCGESARRRGSAVRRWRGHRR